jgi:hypothetical protein
MVSVASFFCAARARCGLYNALHAVALFAFFEEGHKAVLFQFLKMIVGFLAREAQAPSDARGGIRFLE